MGKKTKKERNWKDWLLESAVVLFAVTILVQYITFCYTTGYVAYYGFSANVVELTIAETIMSLMGLLPFALPGALVVVVLIFIRNLLLDVAKWQKKKRHKKGSKSKASTKTRPKQSQNKIIKYLGALFLQVIKRLEEAVRPITVVYAVVFVFLVSTIAIMWWGGQSVPKNRTRYDVAAKYPGQVIVYVDAKKAVFMPLVSEFELDGKYTIVPLEDVGEISHYNFDQPLVVRK
jgi:hypothetical protein